VGAVRQKICDLKDLAELSCREFRVKNDVLTQDAFLIYFKQHCYAYENSCPHTGVTLNWQKEQFFSLDGFFLQCSLHGALFKPDSGECVSGPCQGQSLQPISLFIEDDAVYTFE
jgi:nitrite reductase/ring-hydroxylating ferredoxin subunit